jgi:hypothetical protein
MRVDYEMEPEEDGWCYVLVAYRRRGREEVYIYQDSRDSYCPLICRTTGTIQIDKNFGLNNHPEGVSHICPTKVDDDLYFELDLATKKHAFGDEKTELLSNFFAAEASIYGCFVGIPKGYLIDWIERGFTGLSELEPKDIGHALNYKDRAYGNKPHFKEVHILGIAYIVPSNIHVSPSTALLAEQGIIRFPEQRQRTFSEASVN